MPISFSEFPSVSKADWLQQVAKDLKDKPLEQLHWQPAPGLHVSPFVHADDFPPLAAALNHPPSSWEIGEAIDTGDPLSANAQALEALAFGAEGLLVQLPEGADTAALRQLLQGVYLPMIGLHFDGPAVARNPGAVLAALQQITTEQGLATTQLRGSLAYDPVSSAPIVDWRYLADLLTFARTDFPGFRLIAVQSDAPGTDVVEDLVQLLRRGHFYLQKLTERGVSASEVAGRLHFQLPVGPSYFLEIAKIRAFKLLWLNVLQGWAAPLEYPYVSARFAPAAYTDDLYTNMVRATTLAMSAVVGGVDRLTVRPYADGREAQTTHPPAFGRRIARNVQHLLKMEGGFNQLADPAAGSYYIEQLTGQLGRLVWERFSRSGRAVFEVTSVT